MGCYEQPAITAITPVMAAPITLSGDKVVGSTPHAAPKRTRDAAPVQNPGNSRLFTLLRGERWRRVASCRNACRRDLCGLRDATGGVERPEAVGQVWRGGRGGTCGSSVFRVACNVSGVLTQATHHSADPTSSQAQARPQAQGQACLERSAK